MSSKIGGLVTYPFLMVPLLRLIKYCTNCLFLQTVIKVLPCNAKAKLITKNCRGNAK